MKAYIKEDAILSTVTEFEKFCDYIDAQKPVSTKRGFLPGKACADINQNSAYPYQAARKNAWMDDYPSIMLWFQLGMETGLIEYNNDRKGRPSVEATQNYKQYKALNNFTKYFALFSSWYLDLNHDSLYTEEIADEMRYKPAFADIFLVLGRFKDRKCVLREDEYSHYGEDNHSVFQLLMNRYPQVLRQFKDFGWIDCTEAQIPKRTTNGYGVTVAVQSMQVTQTGQMLAKASKTRRFNWMNRFAVATVESEAEAAVYEKLADAIDAGEEGEMDPFVECFPPGSLDFDAMHLLFDSLHEEKPSAVYDCRVSYGNGFSCLIRCASTHTFMDLHYAIQEAFEFDDDHLYSFFLDGKRYSKNAVNRRETEDDGSPKADEFTLGDAKLRNNQRLLYLFDYGDCWEFDIVVKVAEDGTDAPKVPTVLKTKGKPPRQYG